MPIRVTCPKCQSVAAIPDEYRGRALRCKKCGQPFLAGSPAARKAEGEKPAERKTVPARRPTATPAPRSTPAPRRKRTHGRFLIAAAVAVLVGIAAGFPVAYFLLKKDPQTDVIAAGPVATAPGGSGKGSDGLPVTPPPATGKPEPPRDTGTKLRPVAAPVAWEDFTSRDWGFSARFPGPPQVTSVPGPGTRRPQMFSASVPASPERKAVTFTITCEDHDPRHTADTAAFLDARAAELDLHGKTKNALKLGGFPGVEVRGQEIEGGAWLTTQRIYVVRARSYHLVASGPPAKEVPSFFKEFFDSFKLLDTGEPEPPAVTSLRERALAWLAGNAASPEKVAEQGKELFAPAKDGFGFTLALGEGVLKSKKPALLAGWGGELFLFELSGEQAKSLKLGERDLRISAFPEPPGRRAEKVVFALSDLKITSATPKLAGTVAYRGGAAPTGPFVLRLSYPVGSVVRVRRQMIEAKGDGGTLTVSAPPLTADDPQLSGPVVVLVEVCSADGAGKPEVVLSNPVAALATVVAGPPKDGLASLQLAVPDGWKADYNKFLNVWEVTKPPPTARSEGQILRIEECPDDARTPADYAAHLKEKDFLNVDVPAWVEVGEKADLADGFVIQGVVKKYPDPKTPPILSLLVVRDIDGLKVRCFSANLRDEQSRNQLLEMFKGVGFGPPK
ncbi:MAG TPA: hypothetical protein VKA46_03705 [Gemmataceae bacterium]|nr:hypothetical protein [Gemmataceae bacterium]